MYNPSGMKKLVTKIRMFGFKKLLWFASIELRMKFYRIFFGSYSQFQEDLIIDKLLGRKINGFYVDIGAADGAHYSNTYFFYRKGWRGINIEPDPDNYKQLILTRKNDININSAIGSKRHTSTLYQFAPGVLSTLSKTVAQEFKTTGYQYLGTKKVHTDTLASILDKHLKEKTVDFFTIDTEGYDFVVLQSNNWKKYKPSLICIEMEHANKFEGKTKENQVHIFLLKLGYRLRFQNPTNRIYQLL